MIEIYQFFEKKKKNKEERRITKSSKVAEGWEDDDKEDWLEASLDAKSILSWESQNITFGWDRHGVGSLLKRGRGGVKYGKINSRIERRRKRE